MAEDKYLLFVSKPTGYELVEREGEPPAVGTVIDDDDARGSVLKLAASPLPGDSRVCAYLEGV